MSDVEKITYNFLKESEQNQALLTSLAHVNMLCCSSRGYLWALSQHKKEIFLSLFFFFPTYMDEALPGGSLSPLGTMAELFGCCVVIVSPSALVPLNSLKSQTDLYALQQSFW